MEVYATHDTLAWLDLHDRDRSRARVPMAAPDRGWWTNLNPPASLQQWLTSSDYLAINLGDHNQLEAMVVVVDERKSAVPPALRSRVLSGGRIAELAWIARRPLTRFLALPHSPLELTRLGERRLRYWLAHGGFAFRQACSDDGRWLMTQCRLRPAS